MTAWLRRSAIARFLEHSTPACSTGAEASPALSYQRKVECLVEKGFEPNDEWFPPPAQTYLGPVPVEGRGMARALSAFVASPQLLPSATQQRAVDECSESVQSGTQDPLTPIYDLLDRYAADIEARFVADDRVQQAQRELAQCEQSAGGLAKQQKEVRLILEEFDLIDRFVAGDVAWQTVLEEGKRLRAHEIEITSSSDECRAAYAAATNPVFDEYEQAAIDEHESEFLAAAEVVAETEEFDQ